MTTETKQTLRIRRATPLDAVNLYKLLVDEEKRAGGVQTHNEAERIAHILRVIATGYATVADLSGRIVGSIAFSLGNPEDAKSQPLLGEWFVLRPSFRDSEVGPKLFAGFTRFTDTHGIGARIAIPLTLMDTVEHTLSAAGFVLDAHVFAREPQEHEPTKEATATQ